MSRAAKPFILHLTSDPGGVTQACAQQSIWPSGRGSGSSLDGARSVVSRVMRKFDLALAEFYFRGRVHATWLPSSGQGAKGQGRRYAARLALDAL